MVYLKINIESKRKKGGGQRAVSVSFATLGRKWAWGELVSIKDHAWVVIVSPLEMTVVNVNTTGG